MRKLVFLVLLMPLLVACVNLSTIPTGKEATIEDAFESNNQVLSEAEQEIPDAVTDALIPDFEDVSLTDNNSSANKFNISLHEIEARDFFMGLVIGTDENMLVHPDVDGTISLTLKNVTIAQVMDAVQKVYGYDYRKSGLGYIVYPSTIQTRIFKLNRLDIEREGESKTSVTSGQNNSSTEDESNTSSSDNASSGSSSSWIKTSSKSDFWQDVEVAINSIIAIDPQASAKINPHVGTVVVRAKPMQLREVEQFINITQNQLSRQVILEAKIIEIILDDNHQSGIDWQEVADTYAGATPLFNRLGAVSDNAGIKFTDYVKMLDTQGKTNILSSPRISTLNNQKAIIKVGSDEFFISNVTSSSGGSTGATGSTTINVPTVELSSFFSGIALDVTPQINDDNYVTLHIHPSITRVQSKNLDFELDGEKSSFPMALNTMRESDSIVRAKNDQVIVIGGLMQEATAEGKDGVPFLSRIPGLGNLFRTNSQSTQKSELVILLKPTIIENNSDWDDSKDRSQQKLIELQNHEMWQ